MTNSIRPSYVSPQHVVSGVFAAVLMSSAVQAQEAVHAPSHADEKKNDDTNVAEEATSTHTAAKEAAAKEAPAKEAPAKEAPAKAVLLPVVTRDKGADAFLDVYRVLLHPRCMNCHPDGDVPLQTDDSRPHTMNIMRDSLLVGLPCTTCHRETTPLLPHQPPGLATWHMPSKETPMVFQGRTPAQLCEQLKRPEMTAGRDLEALVHHVENDALVHYGWNPGPGRTTPPISHPDFVLAFTNWVRAGAPCPHENVRVDVKKSATRASPR